MSTLFELTVGYICTDTNALTSCAISLDIVEHLPLQHAQHDNNCYKFGKLGSYNVAMCGTRSNNGCDSTIAAADMMASFPSIKLLILVSSNAGAVPRGVGQVHVGDVVVAQKLVKTNRDGDLEEMDLPQASALLATIGMNTAQQCLLDDDIAALTAKNKRWGGRCRRPAGDDVDKLDKIFAPRRQDEPASLIHRHGLVISNTIYPEDAGFRDSIAGPGKFESASVVCFDHGQTAGLLYQKNVDVVSVLGVSNYCDNDAKWYRNLWARYTSMAASACARRIVLGLATESK
ncbi:hypothetical protein ColLi_13407 [Colletotrichum liriopes]|uniref:Nucleoside phosphorylase domain-containing protein n=1 Tax=Colletotrichum liriopes TaxID=708192 RepID=A0AA37H057_9PEZI|nr:hypothetical protein ColLi_13407 [Colletotrichum liriopes]